MPDYYKEIVEKAMAEEAAREAAESTQAEQADQQHQQGKVAGII